MQSPPDDFPDDDDLMEAARAMIGIFERALSAGDESVSVFDARLLALASAGYSSAGMAKRTGQDPQTIAAHVERLVDAQFVSVSSGHDADTRVDLLSRGHEVIADLGVRHRQELQRVLARLDDDQRGELVDALEAFPLIDVLANHDLHALDVVSPDATVADSDRAE